MFKELAKYNYLGSIEEFQFLFNKVISCDYSVTYFDIEHECRRKPFLFRNGTQPILDYLTFMDFIKRTDNNSYILNCEEQDLRNNSNLVLLIINTLFAKLNFHNEFSSLFDEKTLEFDNAHESYSIRSYHIKPYLNNIKRLLLDISFFKIGTPLKTSLIIKHEFVECFENFLPIRSRKRLPLDKLKELNDLNEKLGKDAEMYVLKIEQERLANHALYSQIVRISEDNASAGYDIESFSSISSTIIDLFIEVKSFSNEIKFYWSRTEVEVAKKLRARYCLCLVNREKINEKGYAPVYIFDPYKEIFSTNSIWNKAVENWLITKK
jgi:hypothetical protein